MVVKEWFVFVHNGNELLRITVNGYVCGEIKETLEQLAYEKSIPVDEITIKIVRG